MVVEQFLEIAEMRRADVAAHLARLVEITCDVVDAGASLGWAAPMEPATARAYWKGRGDALDGDSVFLLGAFLGGTLVGCVQLERGHFPQSRHRGEIAKLMVHSAVRRRGIARALMEALEALALHAGITTLMLDTRPREPVVFLYRRMRYRATGHIPCAIRGPAGDMQGTVFYYKILTA